MNVTRYAVCVGLLAALSLTAGAAEDKSSGTGSPAVFQLAFQKVGPAVVRVLDSSRYCSGLVVSEDGLVVTHRRPAENKNKATVLFADGRKHEAKVLVRDATTKLAVLQLQRQEDEKPEGPSSQSSRPEGKAAAWPVAHLGSSASLRLGSWVATMAYPYGADVKTRSEATLSADILTGRTRLGGRTTYEGEVLLTDAAMNLGSEGGALVNADGEVVGILLGPERHEALKTAVNAALPVETVAPLLKRARENPDPPVKEEASARRTHGFLGVVWSQTDPRAVVGEVVPDGPAEKAGVEVGDVIVQADDKTIQTFEDLIEFLRGTKPGQKVRLTVTRNVADGEAKKEIEVRLGEYPEEE